MIKNANGRTHWAIWLAAYFLVYVVPPLGISASFYSHTMALAGRSGHDPMAIMLDALYFPALLLGRGGGTPPPSTASRQSRSAAALATRRTTIGTRI